MRYSLFWILGLLIISTTTNAASIYLSNGRGVIGVDVSTGSQVFNYGGNLIDLTFGDGIVYGSNGRGIVGVDVVTANQVFNNGTGGTDLVFGAPVPLPSSLVLFSSAIILLTVRRALSLAVRRLN